ncbi:MAG: helix-turn-helix transcriptional regulator [Microlunatus sp.]|nr:helix-turn-helix transcriptional regulator [Microlunatus sp.]
MALGLGYDRQDCAIARALEVVGERWTLLIVRDLFLGVRRFSDLQVRLDISKGVLADRLGHLVDRGLVAKRSGQGHPEYELTPAGVALHPVLMSLATWGREYANPEQRPTRILSHTCGTVLDGAGHCPACDVTPPPTDVISAPDPDKPSRRTDPVSLALREPHRLLEPVR